MIKNKGLLYAGALTCIGIIVAACDLPNELRKQKDPMVVPSTYIGSTDTVGGSQDTTNAGMIKWKTFFTDQNLVALIDSALKNNQELNMMQQEINIAKYEIRGRKGDILPSAQIGAGAGIEKVGKYTRNGAVEENLPIKDAQAFPEALPDFMVGVNASWEVDIWRKLRNSRDAAVKRYLGTIEGRKFMTTNLVAEIASSYYELMALDNKLEILKQNIEIQKNALEIVKLQKMAGAVTELAVRKFEAEVLKNRSHQFYIHQEIIETENRINFLVGRFPQPVQRNSQQFQTLVPDTIYTGVSSQLLSNRPDIVQAERNLEASRLDVRVMKANFYPSLRITGGVGYQAFNPKFLVTTPQSLIYNLAGDLIAPLINRNAIKAKYYTASAKQVQSMYEYERTILNAYIEVVNSMAKIENLKRSYELKNLQVQALTQSITISTNLFKSGNADYMEVLMTQRDALESRFELIEIKKDQLSNWIYIYRSLGGGW